MRIYLLIIVTTIIFFSIFDIAMKGYDNYKQIDGWNYEREYCKPEVWLLPVDMNRTEYHTWTKPSDCNI